MWKKKKKRRLNCIFMYSNSMPQFSHLWNGPAALSVRHRSSSLGNRFMCRQREGGKGDLAVLQLLIYYGLGRGTGRRGGPLNRACPSLLGASPPSSPWARWISSWGPVWRRTQETAWATNAPSPKVGNEGPLRKEDQVQEPLHPLRVC